MGAKFSKGGKVKQNGTDATHDESLDTFNKTSTLPASFRKKDDETTKAGTLPRGGVELERNKSFSKRFRKSITKLVGQNEVKEEASDSQVPTEPSSVVLGQEDNLNDVIEEEVDSKVETPQKELDLKSAQKKARAQFFQELYTSKEPAHIPKPPRSRNIPSPVEKVEPDADITVPATLGTPVVKLIKKHEGEIEKQQELIGTNNSINFPQNENKDGESPQDISESMNKDDVVCASEKQVEEIKQEEVSAVKGETNLREEEISLSLAATNIVNIKEEKSSVVLEEKSSSYEKVSDTVISDNLVETKMEEMSVVKVESYSNEETIMKEEISLTKIESAFEETAVKTEEIMTTITDSMQVDEIKQDEVVKEETTLTEETISKAETSMTQSMALAASNEVQILKEESSVEIKESESIVVTSLSTESTESFSKLEITKEQIGSALSANSVEHEAEIECDESDDGEIKEPQSTDEIENKIESIESETVIEGSEEKVMEGEPEQKDSEEPVMTKDNGVHALHELENKAISSQEEEESMIDQSSSCNAQQDNMDDNLTEPNSLESINQNDEINQSVTEKKDVESTVTGESDLVNKTVILDTDLRSEGGSEGGISTDEGIVASDDEENKSEIHKIDNLEASEPKANEQISASADTEPEKDL